MQYLPCVIWLTGLSGAGKTTTANTLLKTLKEQGNLAIVLDGDDLRHGINKDLGFDDLSRKENIRRTSEIARLFYQQGFIVIVSLISPFEEDRQKARSLFPSKRFIEVFINTDWNTCEKRDTKGLYKKMRAKKMAFFTGIDSIYEPPSHPEIIIDGAKEESLLDNTQSIIRKMLSAISLE